MIKKSCFLTFFLSNIFRKYAFAKNTLQEVKSFYLPAYLLVLLEIIEKKIFIPSVYRCDVGCRYSIIGGREGQFYILFFEKADKVFFNKVTWLLKLVEN